MVSVVFLHSPSFPHKYDVLACHRLNLVGLVQDSVLFH